MIWKEDQEAQAHKSRNKPQRVIDMTLDEMKALKPGDVIKRRGQRNAPENVVMTLEPKDDKDMIKLVQPGAINVSQANLWEIVSN